MPETRYRRYPPPAVALLIELANTAPTTELLPLRGNEDKVLEMLRSSEFRRFRELVGWTSLPGKLSGGQWVLFGVEYMKLWTSRELLHAIAQSHGADMLSFRIRIGNLLLQAPESFIRPRVENGRLLFSLGNTLDVLQGVEVQRIKECPICREIFWAARIDQPACSRHTGTWRARRWRQVSPERRQRYKIQRVRKENRAAMYAKSMNAA